MQGAQVVLSILREKSSNDSSYVFDRIYRYLINKDFYTGFILGDSKNKVELLQEAINLLKEEKFYPQRDCNISNTIKHAMMGIIDSIFLLNHDRVDKNEDVHCSLKIIKDKFNGSNWAIKGTLMKNGDNETKKILVDIVKTRIKDGRFIELLRRFINVKDNYLEIAKVLYKCSDTYFSSRFNNYVRVENEFFILTPNKKELAHNLFSRIMNENKLIIKEETQLFNLNDSKIPFVGYDIGKKKDGTITFTISNNKFSQDIKPYILHGKPTYNGNILNCSIKEIIKTYNKEIADFREYYTLALDLNIKLKKLRYFQYFSLLKTIGCKDKISVNKVIKKYGCLVKTRDKDKTRRVIGIDNCMYIGFDNLETTGEPDTSKGVSPVLREDIGDLISNKAPITYPTKQQLQ